MLFNEYVPCCQAAGNGGSKRRNVTVTLPRIYRELWAGLERRWLALRRPYYKLYPELVGALLSSRLEIPSRFLELHVSPKALFLPEITEPRLELDGRPLASLLIAKISEQRDLQTIAVLGEWASTDGGYRRLEALGAITTMSKNAVLDDEISTTDEAAAHILSAVRLACGACLLVDYASPVVEYDVLNAHKTFYADSTEAMREELFRRARSRGKYGWLLGRELTGYSAGEFRLVESERVVWLPSQGD